MPLYVNPKSVEVVPRGGGEGVLAVLLGGAAIVGIAYFIIANLLVLILGVVGIVVVLAVEMRVLLRYFTRTGWSADADRFIADALAAQQARLTGQPVPAAVPAMTVEVEVVRPAKTATPAVQAPASRPAIAPPYRTIPGYVLNDDGDRVAIEAKQGGPTHAA